MRLLEEQEKEEEEEEGSWDWVTDPVPLYYQVLMQFGCFLSILGSFCILVEVVADHRAGVGTSVTRVLFFLMIGSSLNALGNVWGTLPVPAQQQHQVDDSDSEFWWGNTNGTITTCNLQGFLSYFGGVVAIAWDIVLSVTYVLMVRYNWTTMSLWRVEKVAHAFIWPIVLFGSIGAWVTGSYNFSISFCVITPYPANCGDDEEIECIRGSNAILFRFIAFGFALIGVLVSGTAMITLYCTVREIEQRNKKYLADLVCGCSSEDTNSVQSRSSATSSTARLSTQVGIQGIFYTGTLFLTSVPTIVVNSLRTIVGISSYHLSGVTIFVTSLHGVYYLLVFTRQRPDMRTWYGRSTQRVVRLLCRCCCAGCCCFSCCCCCVFRSEEATTKTAGTSTKTELASALKEVRSAALSAQFGQVQNNHLEEANPNYSMVVETEQGPIDRADG